MSPSDRVSEIFCGLVMVLTVTLLTGHDVGSGPAGVHALLRAALGGNIAWGLIDAVVYLMAQRFEHARQARVVAAVRDAADEGTVRDALEEVIDPEIVAPMTPEEASRVFSALHTLAGRLGQVSPRVTGRDLIGALGCFCLCVASAMPAVVPFLIFDVPWVALRVSNGILLASLFVLGTIWAKQIGTGRLVTGLGLLLVGAALVGLQVAIGG